MNGVHETCKLSILLLFLVFSMLFLPTYTLALHSRQALPFLFLQVFGEQQDSKLLNLEQLNLHSNAIMCTTSTIALNNGAAYLTVNNTSLKSNANISGNIIEKLSDKGMYRVVIRSNQSFALLPKNGFNMQIIFLNASSLASSFLPTNMKQLTPVNSFDIAIYSNNSKLLWQKTNQTINTSTAFETVAFTSGNYSGGEGITIQITNIRPSSVPIGAAIPLLSGSNTSITMLGGGPHNKMQTDSVTFTASVSK
jgi:hypothetical protein